MGAQQIVDACSDCYHRVWIYVFQ